jgi:hypothetical protein
MGPWIYRYIRRQSTAISRVRFGFCLAVLTVQEINDTTALD